MKHTHLSLPLLSATGLERRIIARLTGQEIGHLTRKKTGHLSHAKTPQLADVPASCLCYTGAEMNERSQ